MPDVKFIEIATSLGVPGLALAIFYLLYKRFHFRLPSVPRGYVGPIIILFMLITATVILTTIYWYRMTNSPPALNNDKPEQETPSDTLELERSASQIQNIFRFASQQQRDSLSFSVTTVILKKRPFPELRVTVMNRTKVTQLITGIKVKIRSFKKAKTNPDATVPPTTVIWYVVMPADTGTYTSTAKRVVKLPPDTPAIVDLVFMVKSGTKCYHPGDIGKYNCSLTLITDLKEEILCPESLIF